MLVCCSGFWIMHKRLGSVVALRRRMGGTHSDKTFVEWISTETNLYL